MNSLSLSLCFQEKMQHALHSYSSEPFKNSTKSVIYMLELQLQ